MVAINIEIQMATKDINELTIWNAFIGTPSNMYYSIIPLSLILANLKNSSLGKIFRKNENMDANDRIPKGGKGVPDCAAIVFYGRGSKSYFISNLSLPV